MSVSELILQAHQLSRDEQLELLNALQADLSVEPPLTSEENKPPLQWPDSDARRRKIFGDQVLPNLVLQAREEERY